MARGKHYGRPLLASRRVLGDDRFEQAIQQRLGCRCQLEQAQAQMQGANEMLAQQTAAAGAAADGLDATAVVVAVRDAGAMMNLQPVVEIDLTVMPPGRPPYPAKLRQPVPASALHRVQPGMSVAVKVHRDDPAVVHLMV